MEETGLSRQSQATLKRDFALLTLDSQSRKAIIKKTLQLVKKESVRNKTRQRNPDGTPWTPRKRAKLNEKGKPQKMLRKIYGKSRVDVETGFCGRLHFKNRVEERIATEHHYGLIPEQVGNSNNNLPKREGMASNEQASALIEAGFNGRIRERFNYRGIPRKEQHKTLLLWAALRSKCKPKGGMVSVHDIQRNLTATEAGTLLRLLNTQAGKKRRRKPLAARAAMNTDPKHNAKIAEQIIVERLPK